MTVISVAGRCLYSLPSVHRSCSPLLWAIKQNSLRQLTTAQAAAFDSRCTLCVANSNWHAQRQQQKSGVLRPSRGMKVQATEAEVTEAVAVAGDWLEAQKLDIRVGRVLSAELHPDADSLYVEQVDVGEDESRTIISGLVKYVSIQEMQGRPVMVLCNLKARNMRGIKSDGMLLCASNDTHEVVEPLMPHKDSQAGERVAYGDDETATQPEPETPNKASSVVLP
ncbi:hypothetical protein ABBQ38_009971 [Trebouxia sp. C0009 RCD-2024]